MTTAPTPEKDAMATRTTTTSTVTTVQHIAKPSGRNRQTGPHLADLRAFVEKCDGLPNEVLVHIDHGHVGEDGRCDVKLTATYRHPGPEGA